MIDPECKFTEGKPGKPGPPGKDGKDCQITDDLITKIVAAVAIQLRNDPSLQGKDGADGKDADLRNMRPEDIDWLASQVLMRLPPIQVNGIDPKTGEKKVEVLYLGGDLNLMHLSARPYQPK